MERDLISTRSPGPRSLLSRRYGPEEEEEVREGGRKETEEKGQVEVEIEEGERIRVDETYFEKTV